MVGILEALLITLHPSTEVRLDSPRITVSFRTDQDIFPPSWLNDEIDPKSQPVKTSEEAPCISTLKSAVTKYSPQLTETNLKTVYIASHLAFYGLDYGGTNSQNAVYLTLTPWKDDNFNFRYLERAFHHEFSSILLRNYQRQFPTQAWNDALPKGFEYRGDGTQSLREGTASTRYDSNLNRQGFLAEYSTSSIEEDFNLYAEALFSGDNDFWKIYDRFPAIAKKADIVIDFYRDIDPSFDKSKIRRFAQAQTQ